MYTLSAAPAEDRVFAPVVARVGASSEVRPKQSVLRGFFAWAWRESRRPAWQRLASLPIGRTASGQQRGWNEPQSYRFIKLRAAAADVQVRRLTLELGDGSIQDLSIGCLLGRLQIAAHEDRRERVEGHLAEYQSAGRVRGGIEVWAHE